MCRLISTSFMAMTIFLGPTAIAAFAADNDSHLPRTTSAISVPYMVPTKPMEPKNIPDFAKDTPPSGQVPQATPSTSLQADLSSTTIPDQTRLTLVLECPIDARTSTAGDIFEAHVKNDLFVGRTLLLPRGSLVRGRVYDVTKPRLISRAAKIGLHLEQIVTPTGEVIPLDAALEFEKGKTNQRGQLDPGTSFGTRVESDVKTVTGFNSKGTTRGALMAANIATLGAPAVATLIGSSAVALFRSGDNVELAPGQEVDILLTADLGLQLN